ncbi:MAG: serine protease [Phylliscum demangeonii]|nr:MAG: serine protease [Phylliscum demangeonii]
MRSLIHLSLLPLLVAASPVLFVESLQGAAPIVSSTNSKEVPNSYIVVFKKHVTPVTALAHHDWVKDLHSSSEQGHRELRKRSQIPLVADLFQGVKHTYSIGDLLGYSGHFDDGVIEQVRKHPDVDYIEKDSEVHTMEDSATEKSAPWGLARISHRNLLGFGDFNKYLYSSNGGEGVDVYVIDTGTNVDHVDFEDRAHWGKTIPADDEDEDGNGHGTHCSGTIAGKKFGVAKKAHVYAVKVLKSNGSGTMSDVVKGVEWAAVSHVKNAAAAKNGKGRKGWKGSAANMSLGGGKSVTLDRAVNAAVDVGIHFAVAAGNDNADSCAYSPAAADKAVTVGASTLKDERAYFSNYGKCNDIFAPGLNIQSTWIGSKYATNIISGTSMASPHIAGLLAYLLSLQPAKDSAYAVADITPKKLKQDLINIGTAGALSDIPGNTGNILAWNGGGTSNYTEIMSAGGFVVDTPADQDELPSAVDSLTEAVDALSAELVQDTERLAEKIEEMTGKLGDIAGDKFRGLLGEIERMTEE